MGRSLRRAKRSRPKVRVGVEKKRKNVKAPQPVELKLTGTTQALAAKLPKLTAQRGAAGGAGGAGDETAAATTATTTTTPTKAPTPWNTSRPLSTNYAAAGVAADANVGYGRNSRPDVLSKKMKKMKEKKQNGDDGDADADADAASSSEEDRDDDDESDGSSTDDDLRAASGLPRRHSDRPPPPKLTATQEHVISALRRAHGDDVEAMVRDSRLNRMLLPASKLRKMIEADDVWGRRSGEGGKGRGRCGFRMPKKSL